MKTRSYKIVFSLCLFLSLFTNSITMNAQDSKAVTAIKKVLAQQANDWNRGDINAFMESYWKSDQLQFIGSKGVTYGWQNTKNRYLKRYPDKVAMGQLKFEVLEVNRRSKKVISLVGKFYLKRSIGDLSGHFLLIFQKIKGKWVIVADHTS